MLGLQWSEPLFDFLRRHKTTILLVSTLLYDASPIDVIPDAIPLVGWFDDLGVTGAALVLAAWWWRRRRQAPAAAAVERT